MKNKLTKINFKECRQYSILAWILFNVLRIIPCILFGIPAFIYYAFYCLFHRKLYLERKKMWSKAKTSFADLIIFFSRAYRYKFDLGKGFFDHDSSIFEWYAKYGDCDDVAKYGRNVLNKLGHHAHRIGIIGNCNGKITLHFDCVWFRVDMLDNIETVYLLNYGNIIKGKTLEDAIDNLSNTWEEFPKDKTKICKTW